MKVFPPDPLEEGLVSEYSYGRFLIRHHRHMSYLHYENIVCFNLRDGDLLSTDGGRSIRDEILELFTEEDLLNIFGRVRNPIGVGPCQVGYHEPVIGLCTFREELVPHIKNLIEKVIDRYETVHQVP